MTKLPITVIILTYNEELNLPQCLENVAPHVDEIIVVDSGSTDRTKEIVEKFNAKLVTHLDYKNQAQQFNWALDNLEIKNDWIFRLDADEWVTEELWNELDKKLKDLPEEITGCCIKRRVYFMGRWIKHGGYYPAWFLRIFRKGKARYEERIMDEHAYLTEGKSKKLKNDFADENHKSLSEWTAKHNDFSTREVEARKQESNKTRKQENKKTRKQSLEGQDPPDKGSLTGQASRKRNIKTGFYSKLPLFCRAFAYYFYRYIIRLGFLDGKEGLIFHTLQGFWHQFLIDAKIYESRHKK